MNILLTADWHLSDDKPRCRTDENWYDFQRKLLDVILQIAIEQKADIYHAGDIFDSPVVSEILKNILFGFLLDLKEAGLSFYSIAGNHDLLYHSIDPKFYFRSSYSVIQLSGNIKQIKEGPLPADACNFGEDETFKQNPESKILFIHKLIFPSGKEKYPGSKDLTASDLLKKYEKYEIIVTGDYHSYFIHIEKENSSKRYVINPGTIMIADADFRDYQPLMILWTNPLEAKGEPSFKKILLPSCSDNVEVKYLTEEKERKNRFQSFVDIFSKEKTSVDLDIKRIISTEINKPESLLISSSAQEQGRILVNITDKKRGKK